MADAAPRTRPKKPGRAALERVQVTSREEWRAWLEARHATSPGIWLVTFKKRSGGPHVPWDDVVEEALCFGWIDSTPNKLDDERSMLLLTPRKAKSPWSRINKARVERLLAAGCIAPPGLAAIEAAKADGSWTALDAVEAMRMPEDLATALAADAAAQAGFDAFTPSAKKPLLWWVESAKRAETRSRRIAEIVRASAEGRNPLAFRPKAGG